MRHVRGSLLLASFLAGAPLLAVTALPAQAQFSASISFDSFHGTLAGYGDWLYSDRWGEVWRPLSQDRDPDWRPYWAGHWVPTREYGWTWISDEGEWGDIAYHYGRWVYDPDDGWLWLPGYVWSPAWVVWRSSGPDLGWMPMPPDRAFLGPSFSISVGFGDWNDIGGYYGYSNWYGPSFDQAMFGRLWVFVPGDRIADPGYRRYALARPQTINIIQNSRNITNYTVVNNVIVNRSVTAAVAPQVRAAQPVPANTVLRNTRLVTPVNQGEQIQNRARQERPHGTGQVGSAPPPTPQVIRTLSTRPVPVNTNARTNAGGAPGNAAAGGGRGGERHLFSQANAQELQARARGGQQAPNAAPNAQQPGAPPNARPAPGPNAQPNAQPQPGAQPNAPAERNRDNGRENNPRNENRRGPERQQPPEANAPPANAPPANASGAGRAAPETPPTEDRRGRGPERSPRAMPGQQPAEPPPVMNERPQREQMREPPVREPQREQPQREQPSREPPARSMEQRMPPDRAAPREMPPQREMAPPREQPAQREMPPQREMAPPRQMAPPREQPREQAQPREQPREQARPNNPPPDRGRGQDRGRGNDRDRPDDNR